MSRIFYFSYFFPPPFGPVFNSSIESNKKGNHQKNHATARDGEVTFEKELRSSSSYFQMRNLGTLVTQLQLTLYRGSRSNLVPDTVPKS